MFKVVVFFCYTFLGFITEAQILPVEQLNEVTGKVSDQIEGIKHIKDVNGVLDKFVGTWKATFTGGEIEIVIKKYTRDHSVYVQRYHPEPLLGDELIGKYKLKKDGVVIENTLDLPDDSLEFLTKHRFYDETTYTFSYLGVNHRCGDNGIFSLKYQDSNTLRLRYILVGKTSVTCTSQAEISLPSYITIILTKQ
jgi:hypothetical protein